MWLLSQMLDEALIPWFQSLGCHFSLHRSSFGSSGSESPGRGSSVSAEVPKALSSPCFSSRTWAGRDLAQRLRTLRSLPQAHHLLSCCTVEICRLFVVHQRERWENDQQVAIRLSPSAGREPHVGKRTAGSLGPLHSWRWTALPHRPCFSFVLSALGKF